jgi:hypothetical protein
MEGTSRVWKRGTPPRGTWSGLSALAPRLLCELP